MSVRDILPLAGKENANKDPNATGMQCRRAVRLVVGTVVVSLAVLPGTVMAAGQTTTICQAERLPTMIEGFFRLTTAIGVLGFAVVWQAETLAGMMQVNQENKRALRQHKQTALKSTAILLVLGPLYSVAGEVMNLPLADCINLAPW